MTSWDIIFNRQRQHDALYTGPRKYIPIEQIDLSCNICNNANHQQTHRWQNFWNYISNAFPAHQFNNNTITAVTRVADHLNQHQNRRSPSDIRPLQAAKQELTNISTLVRFNQAPKNTVETFERILLYVATRTLTFASTTNIEIFHNEIIAFIKGKHTDRIDLEDLYDIKLPQQAQQLTIQHHTNQSVWQLKY